MLRAYKSVKRLHQALYIEGKRVREEMVGKADISNVADTALLLKKCSELLDDSRKELDKLLAVLSTSASLVALTGDGTIPRGKIATAHLRTSHSATPPNPKRDPATYADLCAALGVQNTPMARLHFPTIKEMMTKAAEEGKQLPPVFEKLKQHSEVKLIPRAIGDFEECLADVEPLI